MLCGRETKEHGRPPARPPLPRRTGMEADWTAGPHAVVHEASLSFQKILSEEDCATAHCPQRSRTHTDGREERRNRPEPTTDRPGGRSQGAATVTFSVCCHVPISGPPGPGGSRGTLSRSGSCREGPLAHHARGPGVGGE